ncbi:hypothetical protein [Bradyrhizobium archetypum]|uniref:Uncharacterized protein n=1 Tax=Bradyrhizobium archetypum TaxID=2721160 RepID=A0A7Y4M527_9BRAD|nr:hypothetical protein [Bradyrhizobium archetypum]NOJ50458.1 hypothetical protein [Bradyrhizobium archetypum]
MALLRRLYGKLHFEVKETKKNSLVPRFRVNLQVPLPVVKPPRSERSPKLFTEDGFDTEPDRAAEASNDHGQHHLEGEALGLLNALAPFPQVSEICAQLLAVPLLPG